MGTVSIAGNTFLRFGQFAIRRDEIIAVEAVKTEETYRVRITQKGQEIKAPPLSIPITKEEYESIQALFGISSIT